jgi:hypothetical protein
MNKKLKLNKEVIATLNNDSMNSVEGGGGVTHTCSTLGICGDVKQEFHYLTVPLEFEGLCNCEWDF